MFSRFFLEGFPGWNVKGTWFSLIASGWPVILLKVPKLEEVISLEHGGQVPKSTGDGGNLNINNVNV